jgi:hypothetical protein
MPDTNARDSETGSIPGEPGWPVLSKNLKKTIKTWSYDFASNRRLTYIYWLRTARRAADRTFRSIESE